MASLIGQDTARSEFDPGLAKPPITFGVWGDSGNGVGVVGSSSDSAGASSELGGAGVYGLNNAPGGLGVRGEADHQSGVAVLGISAQGTGVTGGSLGTGTGVVGRSSGGTGVSGISSAGVGVTAESSGAAALQARRPAPGGPVIEARLATAERAAEFIGDVQTSGAVTIGANLTSKGFTISTITGRFAVSDATVGAERLTIDPTGTVDLPTGLRTSTLRVSGDAVVGAGGDGSLTLRHIKGKSAKDDTVDDLYLNWDTGQAVHIGRSANRADLQVHGNAVVGAGGDGSLTLRHIKGKSATDDTADDLHLNADTGQPVHIGGNAKRANLQVHGNAVVGAGGDGTLTVRHIKGKSAKEDTADDLHLNADTGQPVHIGSNDKRANLQVHGNAVVGAGGNGVLTVPDGSVGVGTTAPTHPLHVSGVRGVRQNELYLSGGPKWSSLSYNAHHNDQNNNWVFPDPTRPAVTVEMDDNSNTPRFQVWSTTTGNKTGWQLRLAVNGETGAVTVPNGKVGIRTSAPRFELDVIGTACATQYCNPSDLRLKHDIAPVSDVLARLAAIRVVSFRSVSDQDQSASRQLGVIAQEVEPGFPELVVSMAPYGFKAVDYSGLVGVVLAAVNELSARNANLSERLDIVERFHRQASGSEAGDVG